MLVHANIGWNIVILAPATERVEQQNRVLVTQLKKLFTSIFKEQHVAIMKRISDLEGINSVSALRLDLSLNLRRGESKVVDTVAERDSLEEAHAGTGDEEGSLGVDEGGHGVLD